LHFANNVSDSTQSKEGRKEGRKVGKKEGRKVGKKEGRKSVSLCR
jgi:hypothetical protein